MHIKKNLLILILFMTTMTNAQVKGELIYIGDPMCSWCYGFSPELDKIVQHYEQKFPLQIILGGLRPHNTETMADLSGFLQQHWEDVSKASGQAFNYDILKDHTFIYDTEPSSRAVCVVMKMNPKLSFAYFKVLQSAFYAENQNINDEDVLASLAGDFDLDEKNFLTLFRSEEMKKITQDNFDLSKNLGIRGFPSLVLKYTEDDVGSTNEPNYKYYLISNGYQKAAQLIARIDDIVE